MQEHLLAGMGWQPGQGLGREASSSAALVLPALKFDKAGLGASVNVKRLGRAVTSFRRASDSA